MERERKKFHKKLISNCIFSIMSFLSKLLIPPSVDKKNLFSFERLYTNDAPITVRLFPIATAFPALSILTIPLDKCQIKSFENISILIEVILFCLKNFFLKKAFIRKKNTFLKKKLLFETKKFLFGKSTFFLQKILKKNFFF